jgi:hypothetical protein
MASLVGPAVAEARGVAWTEIAKSATKPAQIAMMVRPISRSCLFAR